MIMDLSKYPLLKILLPYVAGILVAYYGQFPKSVFWIFLVTVVVLWLVALLLLRVKRYKWQWLKSVVMLLAFGFAGVSATMFRLSPRGPASQEGALRDSSGFVVRVVDHPVPRAKSVKVVAELWQSDRGVPLRGKVLLYVQGTGPQATSLQYGDILAVSTTLSEFDPPANPDAFDTRRYMQRKGIFYTGFVPASGWKLLGHRSPNPFKSLSHSMQQQLASRYATAGMSGAELAIAQAILLGDDDTMEPELRASYAAAGVSHILCVSGMHVGVIFMILNFLLKPLELFPATRHLKALLLMLAFWFYAHITGLSPSVTRAATMFSFVTVGGVLRRNTNVFHSLAASLFVLLALRPMLMFEVGFQLLLQPRIAGIYTCKTMVANYFWQLLSVSVAAQIATFPVSAHYFGIFPNYFLISNLSVIALSFVVIVTGVGLLAVSFLPTVAGLISFLLTWEIRIMNAIVAFVEGLPGAVTRDIDISGSQVLLLYFCIILLYCLIQYRKRVLFWGLLSSLTLLSGTFALRRVAIERREEMVVYQIRKVCALEFCRRGECLLFSDSIRDAGSTHYGYSIQNHARKLHAHWTFVPIDTVCYETSFLAKRGPFIQFGDKCYYLLKRKERVLPAEYRPHVDVLLLQHNPVMQPEEVASALDFAAVTADETNTPFYKERWRAYCEAHGIPFEAM